MTSIQTQKLTQALNQISKLKAYNRRSYFQRNLSEIAGILEDVLKGEGK